ncbi:MAG: thiamine pyrophosphate-dependent dehydrogenase E1 component subunit alpha [Lentisphaeria bacterium]|nr:thiamine pyrophosphate-dependent dehydrogenase E1 component subunit alpha [Lentisphaeria bacterium]
MTDSTDSMLDVGELADCFRRMLAIRIFEEALSDLFGKNQLGGTSHFCIGQEACAVGVVSALRKTDWLVSNHRGHGHLLARGLDPERVMAELMGRVNGYCGGRGGSQHMCSMEHCFLGTNGITAGGIPIGTGAALALRQRKSDDIAVVFFGDGAGNQGAFHEALNMAGVWKLPVLYVCENNGYGMSNPMTGSTAVPQVSDRAAAYSMPGLVCDGMDLLEVRRRTAELAKSVRAGKGPALLELMTYRYCGHSKNDPRVYRTREEESEWDAKDCIERVATALREAGIADEQIDAIRAEEAERMQIIVQRCLAAPYGDREHALGGVYA